MTTPAERLCSRSWRLRNSLWLLPAILLLGIATWTSFLYIGIKAKRRVWLITAALYGVGMIGIFTLSGRFGDGDKEASTGGESVVGFIIVAIWIGGIVHALITNREWLRWKAYAGSNAAWYAQTAAGVAAPAVQHQETSIDDLLLGRPSAPSTSVPPLPPPPPAAAPPGPRPQLPSPEGSTNPQPAPGGMLDLNLAPASELESQLGFNRDNAQRVVAERSRLGGFTAPDQLMTEAGMPPHVFASIRGRVTVSPLPSSSRPPTRGRRLEL